MRPRRPQVARRRCSVKKKERESFASVWRGVIDRLHQHPLNGISSRRIEFRFLGHCAPPAAGVESESSVRTDASFAFAHESRDLTIPDGIPRVAEACAIDISSITQSVTTFWSFARAQRTAAERKSRARLHRVVHRHRLRNLDSVREREGSPLQRGVD